MTRRPDDSSTSDRASNPEGEAANDPLHIDGVADTSTPGGTPGVLTDVHWSMSRSDQGLFGIVLFALLIAYMISASALSRFVVAHLGSWPDWAKAITFLGIFLGSGGVFFGGSYWLLRRHGLHRVEFLVSQQRDLSVWSLVGDTLAGNRMVFPGAALARFAQTMVRIGRAGESVRVQKEPPDGVQPIVDTFELQPLDESAIEPALLGEGPEPKGVDRWIPGADRLASARSGGLRSIRRMLNYRGGVQNFIALFLMFLLLAYFQYMMGMTRFIAVYILIWVGIGFAVSSPVLVGMLYGEWFVVPGAVVIRKSRSFGRGDDVKMLRRTEAVLCVHRVQHRWQVIVADAGRTYSTFVSELEMLFLLRAWLSPAATPPLESVRELL